MEAERPVATGNWLYLYGIVRRSELDLAGVKGIEGGGDVFLVRGGELACAVSPVSRAEYNQETLTARAQQLDWIAPRAVRHQQVVQRLLATGAVIPLKFGTLCSTTDDVRDILLARQEPWLRLLEFLQGREEWGVRIYADANLTRQALEQECSATDGVPPASPGEAYFLKKKRQKLASERMVAHIAALDDQIYGRLAPCAVDARKGSCQGSPPEEPSRLSVLKAALLMEQDRSAALEEIAGQLEADYREYGMVVELTGPWAPYSFCGGLDKAPAGDGTARVPEPCGN